MPRDPYNLFAMEVEEQEIANQLKQEKESKWSGNGYSESDARLWAVNKLLTHPFIKERKSFLEQYCRDFKDFKNCRSTFKFPYISGGALVRVLFDLPLDESIDLDVFFGDHSYCIEFMKYLRENLSGFSEESSYYGFKITHGGCLINVIDRWNGGYWVMFSKSFDLDCCKMALVPFVLNGCLEWQLETHLSVSDMLYRFENKKPFNYKVTSSEKGTVDRVAKYESLGFVLERK